MAMLSISAHTPQAIAVAGLRQGFVPHEKRYATILFSDL
jgi:hypothetical protein